MNKERRAALATISDRVEALKAQYEAAKTEADSIREDLEALRDEEQDYFDNMPESFQNGDKGSTATDAVSEMESAMDLLDSLEEPDFDSAVSSIDNARGAA